VAKVEKKSGQGMRTRRWKGCVLVCNGAFKKARKNRGEIFKMPTKLSKYAQIRVGGENVSLVIDMRKILWKRVMGGSSSEGTTRASSSADFGWMREDWLEACLTHEGGARLGSTTAQGKVGLISCGGKLKKKKTIGANTTGGN